MARFALTSAAATKLREMIAGDKRGRDVIAVYWEAPKVDNRRGPNGETRWILEAEGIWKLALVDEQELEGQEPELVDGLKFLVLERMHKPKLAGRTIDHVAEGFIVS